MAAFSTLAAAAAAAASASNIAYGFLTFWSGVGHGNRYFSKMEPDC